MNILGFNAGAHDAAVSVVSYDGDILFAGHAERYSRVKNDPNLNALILDEACSFGSITKLAYYEKPWLKHTREIYSGEKPLFSLPNNPRDHLQGRFKNIPLNTYHHHLSHAAGGFQTSDFHSAICLVVDAIGEWDCWSIWKAVYDDEGFAKYEKLWSEQYPNSLGLYYSAMTQAAGLKPNEEEYILMGMAVYGDKEFWHDQFKSVVDVKSDPFSFKAKENMHRGTYVHKNISDVDIAAMAQNATEIVLEMALKHVSHFCDKYNIFNIVYSGGVALNCVANTEMWIQPIVDPSGANFWIMPNPGDAGSSLGAAALAYGKKLNWEGPFLGTNIPGNYPVKSIIGSLQGHGMCGVANGRAEFGPRALGNRSLLADPRRKDIKDIINTIKRRQKFRPFAPVILEEYFEEYFDGPESEYMQFTASVRKPNEFPGICHVDETARVQVVPKNCKSGIRELLEQWYFWSGGCPMLLNTSLNIKGEPMVNNREDARRWEKEYSVRVW